MFFRQLNYTRTCVFHTIFMLVIIGFSRFIGTYSNTKIAFIKTTSSINPYNKLVYRVNEVFSILQNHSLLRFILFKLFFECRLQCVNAFFFYQVILIQIPHFDSFAYLYIRLAKSKSNKPGCCCRQGSTCN